MIQIKYGEIPKENFSRYFEFLINKTYKILPLKEEKSETLKSYLESYQRELIGNKELISILVDEPKFISVLATMEYLITEEYSTAICKKEVFKCIKILDEIKKKYFGDGDSDRQICCKNKFTWRNTKRADEESHDSEFDQKSARFTVL